MTAEVQTWNADSPPATVDADGAAFLQQLMENVDCFKSNRIPDTFQKRQETLLVSSDTCQLSALCP